MNHKVALVTGANQGIGLEAVNALSSRGIETYPSTRDESLGRRATESLRREQHEHANNGTEKKYSRNLGKAQGIELFQA